jgi:hypothetical protein
MDKIEGSVSVHEALYSFVLLFRNRANQQETSVAVGYTSNDMSDILC